MAEPENHTLHLLREIRRAIAALDTRFETLDAKIEDVRSRLDNIRQAAIGESVLGRYAAAEVDERLEAIEKRLAALEEAQ